MRKVIIQKLLISGIKSNYRLQDPEAAYITAAAHFRLGNMQKACGICELIEGPFTECKSSMYAAILRRLNLFTRAEEVFKQALSIEPNSKEIKKQFFKSADRSEKIWMSNC